MRLYPIVGPPPPHLSQLFGAVTPVEVVPVDVVPLAVDPVDVVPLKVDPVEVVPLPVAPVGVIENRAETIATIAIAKTEYFIKMKVKK